MKRTGRIIIALFFMMITIGCAMLSADETDAREVDPVPTEELVAGGEVGEQGITQQPAMGEEIVGEEKSLPEFEGINYWILDGYQASSNLIMESGAPWTYELLLQSDGSLAETGLMITGVSKSLNPGDVRYVTDGEKSFLKGEGTDHECLRFPISMAADITFYTLDDVFPPESIRPILSEPVVDTINGEEYLHYFAENASIPDWLIHRLDIWIDLDVGLVSYYVINATGDDPLFNSGSGKLSATYELLETEPVHVERVEGCQVPYILPDDAADIVQFPGLVSFRTGLTGSELKLFLQDTLKVEGWSLVDDGESSEESLVLSFMRGEDELMINIEFDTIMDDSMVEIIRIE